MTVTATQAATTTAGVAVLIVGMCLATGHYCWQARRVRRAEGLHRQSNDRYLS